MMIKSQFDLDMPVFVIAKKELEEILRNAPDWWGNDDKEIYDNLIFIMPPATFADVFNEIGEPKVELENTRLQRSDILVIRPKKLSKDKLVVKNSERKYQQQINNKDGKYCQESSWNVGTRN